MQGRQKIPSLGNVFVEAMHYIWNSKTDPGRATVEHGYRLHHARNLAFIGKHLKPLSQIPALAQRVKRLWTLFQLPYPGGRSFHWAPLRSTHRTPLTKVRLSLAVTPTQRQTNLTPPHPPGTS